MSEASQHCNDAVSIVPYGEDPLAILVEKLIQDHEQQLPDLTRVTVLLPDLQSAPRLRRLLLEQAGELGHQALLGPRIQRLADWVASQPFYGNREIDYHSRELMLVDALREYRNLFGEGNLWALADSLLELFDELTLNKIGLPQDLDAFTKLLSSGYGPEAARLAALEREARLVHTLWQAWHQQLHSGGYTDPHTAYLLRLSTSGQTGQHFYLAGFTHFNKAEIEWLKKGANNGQLQLFLHGQPVTTPLTGSHPGAPLNRLLDSLGHTLPANAATTPYSEFLEAVYPASLDDAAPLAERAHAFAATHPQSPAAGRIALHHARGAEEEAVAISLQVRQWLLDGHGTIAIVTENRRVARRLRALLERSGIILDDSAGWAMSTTSAAATLERWLECIEDDFPYQALLDLLKSPFFVTGEARDAHMADVYRLEQDLVHHENIGSGLQRYRFAVHSRIQRLPQNMASALQRVEALLERLDKAATRLRSYYRGHHPPEAILTALQQSLQDLQMDTVLANDAAGQCLLDLLEQMQAGLTGDVKSMGWYEFRTWLGRNLERFHFRPANSPTQVQLMGLGQSTLARYDALIIASAEREHLPGSLGHSPFFNDAVRRQLGLRETQQLFDERFYHFRRLLEAAPRVLITLRREQDGETILPSPWLETLRSFHHLAYQERLEDQRLAQVADHPAITVVDRHRGHPAVERQPAPSVPAALLPSAYSASAYQQLVDCPFQFFSARCLGLAPPDTIREALEKADYGEKVHRCLEAFHGGVPELPGPFNGQLTQARKNEAVELMERIARKAFASNIEDNFIHRGWLQRWLETIPTYIDWQIEHARQWQVAHVEQRIEQFDVQSGITLQGRLDRIDRSGDGHDIIDYKTGHVPGIQEVSSGESVQLPFYRMLYRENPVQRVEYLGLDRNKVTNRVFLEEDELETLTSGVSSRLQQLVEMMQQGAPFPAWGDEKVCGFCQMDGICRLSTWKSMA